MWHLQMVCSKFAIEVNPFFRPVVRQLRAHFLKEARKVMYFVCLSLLLVELEKMTAPKRSTSGTRLLRGMNFLTYHSIFWNLRPLKITIIAKFSVQVGVALDKKVEEGTNAVRKSGYFPACNAFVMLKIEARPRFTRIKGCSSAREANKNKD